MYLAERLMSNVDRIKTLTARYGSRSTSCADITCILLWPLIAPYSTLYEWIETIYKNSVSYSSGGIVSALCIIDRLAALKKKLYKSFVYGHTSSNSRNSIIDIVIDLNNLSAESSHGTLSLNLNIVIFVSKYQ